jgi:chromosome segregation ATPase
MNFTPHYPQYEQYRHALERHNQELLMANAALRDKSGEDEKTLMGFRRKNGELKIEITQLRRASAVFQDNLAAVERENAALQTKITEYKRINTGLTYINNTLEEKAADLSKTLEVVQDECKQKEVLLNRALAENAELAKKNSELISQIVQTKKELCDTLLKITIYRESINALNREYGLPQGLYRNLPQL